MPENSSEKCTLQLGDIINSDAGGSCSRRRDKTGHDADLEYAEDQPDIIQEPEIEPEPEIVAEQPQAETPAEPEDLGFGTDPALDELWGE